MPRKKTIKIELPGRLTIADVHDQKQSLLGAVADDGHISVDATATTTIDTAGLQLILALKKTAEGRDCRFDWQYSKECADVARLVRIDDALGIEHE